LLESGCKYRKKPIRWRGNWQENENFFEGDGSGDVEGKSLKNKGLIFRMILKILKNFGH